MINNFEELTDKLSYQEKQAIPTIIQHLKTCIGKENAAKNSEILLIVQTAGHQIKYQSRIRKIITYIRVNNLCEMLIASSKGYYIAESKSEFRFYIKGLRDRAGSINYLANVMEENFNKTV